MLHTDFHFLRPAWLMLLIPAAFLYWQWLKFSDEENTWRKVVAAHLLPRLLVKREAHQHLFLKYATPIACALAGILAIGALAGPTWSRLPQALYLADQVKMIVVDMSPAMEANDVAPNRYTRAKFKAIDLLRQMREGQIGMIAFAAEPYVVSPLTRDANTIIELIPELAPQMMPSAGSDVAKALEKAGKLFQQAGMPGGEIFLVTASAISSETLHQVESLHERGYQLFVLGMDPANAKEYAALANVGGGRFVAFSDTHEDIDQLTQFSRHTTRIQQTTGFETTSLWKDQGRGLLLPVLILAALIFRRGWFEKIV